MMLTKLSCSTAAPPILTLRPACAKSRLRLLVTAELPAPLWRGGFGRGIMGDAAESIRIA